MDPDATLKKMREAYTRLFDLIEEDGAGGVEFEEVAEDLANAAQDLDVWISRKGMLPINWSHSPPAEKQKPLAKGRRR